MSTEDAKTPFPIQEPGGRGRRTGRSRLRLIVRLILALLIVSLIAGIGGWIWLRKVVSEPVYHSAAEAVITIEPGIGTRAIVSRLTEAGIVRNPRALTAYLIVMGRSGDLKAGDYKFSSPISPLDAIAKIQRGDVYYQQVTVPEGFNRFEIADTLAEKTGKGTPQDFLRIMSDTTLIAKLAPGARNLEGYLFPDTYKYAAQNTADDLIEAMVRRFHEVFTAEWAIRASRIGMSTHQIVTLASIIEEEARIPADRPLIASVLHNRLKRGMLLAADPTFIYAAIIANDYDGNPNQPRHRRRLSLYNTYVYSGLPPGPIASPGKASLEAALYPTETDYLYFVVGNKEGGHKFSRTAAEHSAAVEEYYRLRRSLNQSNGAGK